MNAAAEDLSAPISGLTGGHGAAIVIGAAGLEESVRAAIRHCKKGATIILVGCSRSDDMTLHATLAAAKEPFFKTVFRYRKLHAVAINPVAAGVADPEGIVSVYEFGAIQQDPEARSATRPQGENGDSHR